jgi:electron transport complex protein RnfG
MSEKLPVVEPQDGAGPPPPPPIEVEPSAIRLIGTLAVAGAIAGLAIVLVFQWARPKIEEYQARVLAEAITDVLAGPARYDVVFVEDGALTMQPAADTTGLDRVYVGYDDANQPVGIAVVGGEPGFQDIIRLIFGYDPGTGEVLGMKVLESKETPGLGDKIEKDSTFIRAFARVATPLLGVKKGRETGSDGEVVTITGATISSKAIIDIINHRVEALGGPMGSYWTSPAAVGSRDAGPEAAPTPATTGGGGP